MTIHFLAPHEARRWLAAGALAVDLRSRASYVADHPRGAVHLDVARLNASRAPVGGLLPSERELARTLGGVGIGSARAVVALDAEGQASGRLLWCLEVMGHAGELAILDGAIEAWREAGLPRLCGAAHRTPVRYDGGMRETAVARADYILEHLGDPAVVVLDVRSAAEFRGEDVRAARGGRIPGAISFDWRRVFDTERGRRLRPRDALRDELASLGVTQDKEVVVYCQTHQRSSHTYAVLRALGFARVRGYPGAWSQWGNDARLPIETG